MTDAETVSAPSRGRRRKWLLIGVGVAIIIAASVIVAISRANNGKHTPSASSAGARETKFRWTIEHCGPDARRRGGETRQVASTAGGHVTFLAGDRSPTVPSQTVQVVDQHGVIREQAEVILAAPVRAVGDNIQWSADFDGAISRGWKCRFAPVS